MSELYEAMMLYPGIREQEARMQRVWDTSYSETTYTQLSHVLRKHYEAEQLRQARANVEALDKLRDKLNQRYQDKLDIERMAYEQG